MDTTPEPKRFIVIGAGGIGTWACHGFARMLEYKAPGSALLIVDGDSYEPKNIERQLFTRLGNKALMLANDVSQHVQQTIVIPLPQWVVAETVAGQTEEDGENASKIAAKDLLEDGDVVFSLVDNFKARKDVFDAAREINNIDVFTGGNDENLFGSTYHYIRRDGKDVTMHPSELHQEYVNPPDRNPGELSCQERAELQGGTQLLATNMTVASILLGRVQATIIDGVVDDKCEIYFDLAEGLMQPYDRRVVQTPTESPLLEGAIN